MTVPVSNEMFAKGLVLKGKSILDQRFPDWRQRIDFRKLDVGDESLNPLAQLYGRTSEGMIQLGMDRDQAIDHGFLLHPTLSAKNLNDAWRS